MVRREDEPSDRRVVLNVLTAKGEEMMERIQQGSDAALQRVVDGLSAEEQVAIAQSLKRLDEALAASS